MESTPLFDEEATGRLTSLGGAKFAMDMIDMFFEYADSKLEEGRTALEAGDIAGVEKAIHPLKTSSGHVGAARMRDISQEIERLAPTESTEAIGRLVADLSEAYLETKPLLEAHRRRIGEQ